MTLSLPGTLGGALRLPKRGRTFAAADGERVHLSDELIAERRAEAAIEDGPTLPG